ncbi:MAG TPA: aminotransferase class V-fold PLP-dependent enzyme, partial [Chlamydiales bacterium]|nr:aminotransferase class V-fold PLP-dependent enzyme [Chlamydiales bacterium]
MLARTIHNHPFVYLDSAATAQKPASVIEAISNFYANSYGTVHRAVYQTAVEASHEYQQVRGKVARFLHAASDDEIIFQRGTTTAVNLVAASFGKAFVNADDEVIITEMEHHSNIVPWQMMCEARGATLHVIPFFDNGLLDMQALQNKLSSKTKIVSCAHISNVLGTINPIKEIIQAAHDVDAKVLIDGAQSAPHIAVDVQALDADFFVFSGHKAVGPTGIGVLYGKKELLEKMPPFEGGGDMI